MPRHRAVVVEDDQDIRELLTTVLRAADLEVVCASSGEEGVELVRRHDPDLVTLDLSLPDIDGVEVCRRVRSFTDAYVMMITGRVEEADRLAGLDVGADDYLSKPVSPREVQARAAALLRRPRLSAGAAAPEPAEESVFDAGGGLVLVRVRQVALLDGEPLPLTPAELDLLSVLSSRPGQAWSREELVREVWQGEFIESDFLVDVQVAGLRRKLRRAASGQDWISAVGGASYRFDRAP